MQLVMMPQTQAETAIVRRFKGRTAPGPQGAYMVELSRRSAYRTPKGNNGGNVLLLRWGFVSPALARLLAGLWEGEAHLSGEILKVGKSSNAHRQAPLCVYQTAKPTNAKNPSCTAPACQYSFTHLSSLGSLVAQSGRSQRTAQTRRPYMGLAPAPLAQPIPGTLGNTG